jgi:4-hydroxy-tetrahydrodipicolinate reductase
MDLVGAIDVDPQKVGRDVAALLADRDAATGVTVADAPEAVLAETAPDVVLHTTTSALPDVMPQLRACLAAGAHVVSSTEELSYPYAQFPERATALDRAARAAGGVLVGTGVNPGYAMDTFPLSVTGVCTSVDVIRVVRVVDAAERRGPLQQKVGAGLSPEAFAQQAEAGALGHVGLPESLRMLAEGLGWTLDAVEDTIDPVRAEAAITTDHVSVPAGAVAGLHQRATGSIDGTTVLTLELTMALGADEPRDRVVVDGRPPMDVRVDGGIFGDTATVGMLVNTAGLVDRVAPGLKTMLDLPTPRAHGRPRG